MATNNLNHELLGRLAQGLEDSGRALKAQDAKITQLCVQDERHETQIIGVHARLKRIEEKIDGNGGGSGLKTDIALASRTIEQIEADIKDLKTWRRESSDKRLVEFKHENRNDKTLRWTIILALGSMATAIGSIIVSLLK